jgi:hypothetical protein
MTHAIIEEPRPPAAARGAADWLSLAAAPTFAIMALLTAVFGGPPDMLCAALQGASPLSGMIPMYLLMSAFHAGPWLRLTQPSLRAARSAPKQSRSANT